MILFEPWNLGDAFIAAAIRFQDPARLTLACNSRWHPLIRAAAEADGISTNLIAADLDYVNRGCTGRIALGTLPSFATREEVVTIRE